MNTTQHIREQLVAASLRWQQTADQARASDPQTADPADMAAAYAYTLAAAIRLVEETCGPNTAQQVALDIQAILDNGDFDDLNADVRHTP